LKLLYICYIDFYRLRRYLTATRRSGLAVAVTLAQSTDAPPAAAAAATCGGVTGDAAPSIRDDDTTITIGQRARCISLGESLGYKVTLEKCAHTCC
jgi:hypothetical protein